MTEHLAGKETEAAAQAVRFCFDRKIPLLPVYYIAEGETMAAVNGQTGKVSVRAEKASHYYFLPWWFKAILATLLVSKTFAAGLREAGAREASQPAAPPEERRNPMRQTRLEISLNALEHNAREIRRALPPAVRMMAVVKASVS